MKFIFTPDLTITESADGWNEAEVDSNDEIDELHYRFEISDTLSGSGIDGNWINKPLAAALAPAAESLPIITAMTAPAQRPHTKFLPNRITIYPGTSIDSEATYLASKTSWPHQHVVANSVFDLSREDDPDETKPAPEIQLSSYNGLDKWGDQI